MRLGPIMLQVLRLALLDVNNNQENSLFHRKIIFTVVLELLCEPAGDFVGYDVVVSLRQS